MKNILLEIKRKEGKNQNISSTFTISVIKFSFSICCILTILTFLKREYIAEVRVVERERANREMARQAELQHEMRQSVTAMEQMLESQQRIEQLQRSLAYLRELHSRMVCLNI